MTKPIENVNDPRMVRALSHPLRVRILALLEERTASALELARILKADLGVVAYHVRKLHRLGLIELVRETRVRGATQRHYRALERPRVSAEAWAKASPVVKQALVSATLQQVNDYAQGSAMVGGFDRPDAHLTRTALRLDREGWTRLATLLLDLLAEVSKIEREAREREASGEAAQLEDVGLVLMLFQALPFSRQVPRQQQDEAAEHNSPFSGL